MPLDRLRGACATQACRSGSTRCLAICSTAASSPARGPPPRHRGDLEPHHLREGHHQRSTATRRSSPSLVAGERDTRELFFALALEDVRRAADVLAPVYTATPADRRLRLLRVHARSGRRHRSHHRTGAATCGRRLQRPNTMIKVPATAAGVPAIERLTADGVNVNVTLLFSVDRYQQVIDAYRQGWRRGSLPACASIRSRRSRRSSCPESTPRSTRSFPAGSAVRGRAAVANATLAFSTYRRSIASDRWRQLAAAGARPSVHFGRAPEPRTTTTPTSSTSSPSSLPGSSTPCPRPRSTPSRPRNRDRPPHSRHDAARGPSTSFASAGIDLAGSPKSSNGRESGTSATPMRNSSRASISVPPTFSPRHDTDLAALSHLWCDAT